MITEINLEVLMEEEDKQQRISAVQRFRSGEMPRQGSSWSFHFKHAGSRLCKSYHHRLQTQNVAPASQRQKVSSPYFQGIVMENTGSRTDEENIKKGVRNFLTP